MLSYAALCRRSGAKSLGQTLIVLNLAKASHSRKIAALRDFDPADVALGHSRHSRHPGVSRSPPKADIRPVLAFMSTRPNTTLADLLRPPLVANPFSTMRASLRR